MVFRATKKCNPFLFLLLVLALACQSSAPPRSATSPQGRLSANETRVRPGAERLEVVLPLLRGKRVGLVVNHTSLVGQTHLVDTLLASGIKVVRIFAPEHGFRGTADAGERLTDSRDPRTGLPVISLYGKKKKPAPKDLAGLDLVVYDIQDVGARFYTYISTMSLVMEACAEQGVPFLVLDRPDPNGHYVDGPVLDTAFRSFVGMHPVPVVYGMTPGEYARMVNGEGWLKGGIHCALDVVPCAGYTHDTPYTLPVRPSPNLPNMRAVYLYPSLCFFEPTVVSVGRGTDKQFQVIGAPEAPIGDYEFRPMPMPGARHPKHEGKRCRGFDLTTLAPEAIRNQRQLDLSWLIRFYQAWPDKSSFFLSEKTFDRLAGTDQLRRQLAAGMSEEEIRQSWQQDLQRFRLMRRKYLLYD